jgi:hypothetical protein
MKARQAASSFSASTFSASSLSTSSFATSRLPISGLSSFFAFLLLFISASVPALHADNRVMGEIQLEGRSKVEKTSGVWVDGQYVGYLKELKGSKKVMLLPGDHEISVRQAGYQDFTRHITVRPGEKQVIQVAMLKAQTGPLSPITAEVKISVNPSRAAVFVDGQFMGHVGEFQGAGHGLLVAPGEHKIKIALPGYKSFETDINPVANQRVEVKTDLQQSAQPLDDPSLRH